MDMSIIKLLIGLGILMLSGMVLVPGIIGLAERLGISARIIAFVIVAGGTSAPELLVSVNAALQNSPGIVWGNVLGSNIANSLLVLGIGALVAPIATDQRLTRLDLILLLGITGAILLALYLDLFSGWQSVIISSGLMAVYILYIIHLVRTSNNDDNMAGERHEQMPLYKSLFFSIGSVIGLVWGADLVVSGWRDLAYHVGWSEAFIGMTIIAIGTSLPELISVAASLFHRRSDIALGNALGSNLFNILIALGAAGVMGNIQIGFDIILFPALFLAVITALLLLFCMLKQPMGLKSGFVFIGFYLCFLFIQSTAFST